MGSINMVIRQVAAGVVAFGMAAAFAMPARAACYTAEQAQAELALRIHSELMVIGLSCAAALDDPAIFNRYIDFTQRHAHELHGYEQALTSFFANSGKQAARKRFDTWRTTIANAVSTRAALSSTQIYCDGKKGLLQAAAAVPVFDARAIESLLVSDPEATVTSMSMCNGDRIALNLPDTAATQ